MRSRSRGLTHAGRAAYAAIASVAIAFAAACGRSDVTGSAGDNWTATVDSIGDTVSVHTTAGQVWPSDGHLVSEVAIGVLEGDPQYEFGRIQALAVDGAGNIYVLDSHGPVLRSYDPRGAYLIDIGREGEGPGEFKRPDGGLATLPDGHVVLRDPGNGQLLEYRSDGTHVASRRLSTVMSTSQPMVATAHGDLVTPIIKDVSASPWELALARYRADGAVDTLDVPKLDFALAEVWGAVDDRRFSANVPFTPQRHRTFSPAGFFLAGVSGDYRVLVVREDGSVTAISKAYTPIPVRAGESDFERKRIVANMRQNIPDWRWNGPVIPSVKPPYSDLFAAEDGRIWVRLHAEADRFLSEAEQREEEDRIGRPVNPFREPVVFDVFEPEGDYLGRVDTPAGFQTYPVPVFRGDTVWAVVTDELDVAQVHRLVVRPGA